ncbi:hypothetical protein GF361_00410 [Candidatus Woesearchaeota archaeon]|nr:hypothetical protein [Candidatus Woesearchaeota archaeon]
MAKAIAGIIINEVETEPLSGYVIDFLTTSTRESPFLDFKKTIDLRKSSAFPETAKDIFAFSNYGGGWILLGWEEHKKNQFVPVGLSEDFEFEPANLQTKFDSYSIEPLAFDYTEFRKDFKDNFPKAKDDFKQKINSVSDRFGVIYVPPSSKLLIPSKKGEYEVNGKKKCVFYPNDVFYRRGTQSIRPSSTEKALIEKRLKKENYRLSLLSGEPDEVEETIYSNLFEIKQMPVSVYYGKVKDYDNVSIKALLKQEKVFPEWYFKFKYWSGNLVTFENLSDNTSPYSKLVVPGTIKEEPLSEWIKDSDKFRVVKEILNREIRHHAMRKGIWLEDKKYKLYYPAEEVTRKEKWKSRYAASNKTVATKFYVPKLKRYLYWHVAFYADVLNFNDKFYLKILPSFIISEDGKKILSDPVIGTLITSLSYNKYNSLYLNNVLFWIHQIGEGNDIKIGDYMTISKSPVDLKASMGILYDLPSNEFRLEIPEDEEGDTIEDG